MYLNSRFNTLFPSPKQKTTKHTKEQPRKDNTQTSDQQKQKQEERRKDNRQTSHQKTEKTKGKTIQGGDMMDCLTDADIDSIVQKFNVDNVLKSREFFDFRTQTREKEFLFRTINGLLVKFDCVFLPVHLRHHWLLCCVSWEENSYVCRIYDSAPSPVVKRDLHKWLPLLFAPLSVRFMFCPSPRQTRGSNECGLFLCCNIAAIHTKNEKWFSLPSISLDSLRKHPHVLSFLSLLTSHIEGSGSDKTQMGGKTKDKNDKEVVEVQSDDEEFKCDDLPLALFNIAKTYVVPGAYVGGSDLDVMIQKELGQYDEKKFFILTSADTGPKHLPLLSKGQCFLKPVFHSRHFVLLTGKMNTRGNVTFTVYDSLPEYQHKARHEKINYYLEGKKYSVVHWGPQDSNSCAFFVLAKMREIVCSIPPPPNPRQFFASRLISLREQEYICSMGNRASAPPPPQPSPPPVVLPPPHPPLALPQEETKTSESNLLEAPSSCLNPDAAPFLPLAKKWDKDGEIEKEIKQEKTEDPEKITEFAKSLKKDDVFVTDWTFKDENGTWAGKVLREKKIGLSVLVRFEREKCACGGWVCFEDPFDIHLPTSLVTYKDFKKIEHLPPHLLYMPREGGRRYRR